MRSVKDWIITYINRSTGLTEHATHTGSDCEDAAVNFYNTVRSCSFVAEIIHIEPYTEQYY